MVSRPYANPATKTKLILKEVNMSPRKAFDDQVRHAQARNIPFLLSYAEWLEMWLVSGQWENRGKKKGQYQMCRHGDSGAYSVRNCYIGTVAQNQREKHSYTDEETEAIIRLYKNTDLPQHEIAKRFNITQSAVSRIVNNKRRVC
jgi:hypothetical protein